MKPLLPSNLPILVTLSSPLSPTSAPLISAQRHLRELLLVLKSRCAPIRDKLFDGLLETLNLPLPKGSVNLARPLVDTIRGILQAIEVMKSDLTQFVFNQLSEAELAAEIRVQAQLRERQVIMELLDMMI